MAISKELLIDWLSEVPDGADIGIEVDQRRRLNLVAFSGEDQSILVVGGIPEEHKKVNPQSNGKQH